MDEHRNKIIVGAVIVTVVVVVTIFVVFKSISPTCVLSNAKPDRLDPDEIKPVALADYKALTSLDAYLIYPNDDTNVRDIYMPLRLGKLSVSKTDSGHQVVLDTNCAKINMDFKTTTKSNVVKSMQVDLRLAKGDDNRCEIIDGFLPDYPSFNSYYCAKFREYDCFKKITNKDGTATTKTVVKLVVNTFEIEIDGNPEKIKHSIYSKPPYDCY